MDRAFRCNFVFSTTCHLKQLWDNTQLDLEKSPKVSSQGLGRVLKRRPIILLLSWERKNWRCGPSHTWYFNVGGHFARPTVTKLPLCCYCFYKRGGLAVPILGRAARMFPSHYQLCLLGLDNRRGCEGMLTRWHVMEVLLPAPFPLQSPAPFTVETAWMTAFHSPGT